MTRKTLLFMTLMISFFAVAGEMTAYFPPPLCVPDCANVR